MRNVKQTPCLLLKTREGKIEEKTQKLLSLRLKKLEEFETSSQQDFKNKLLKSVGIKTAREIKIILESVKIN